MADPIPVCDLACQKEKQLSGLLSAMQVAEHTSPEAYEQARIQYYTLKEGQGWLAKEKERLAKLEVEPILRDLDAKYAIAQAKVSQYNQVQELVNSLKNKQIGDEEESRYISNQLSKERDKVDVAQRLSILGPSLPINTQWLTIALDVVIALLALYVVYSLTIRSFAIPNTLPLKQG